MYISQKSCLKINPLTCRCNFSSPYSEKMCIIRQPVNFFTKNDNSLMKSVKKSVKFSVKFQVKCGIIFTRFDAFIRWRKTGMLKLFFCVSHQRKKYTCKFILPLLHNFYVYVNVELFLHVWWRKKRYVKIFLLIFLLRPRLLASNYGYPTTDELYGKFKDTPTI